MGGMFMYVGSGLYVYQVFKLARQTLTLTLTLILRRYLSWRG